jgi:hypothetical protein
MAFIEGADDGIRTHTPIYRKRILSPLRLPFRHIGTLNVAVYPSEAADQTFSESAQLHEQRRGAS